MVAKKTKGKSGAKKSPAADRGPSEQMLKFVELYVETPNATKAAIGAGYSERSAYSTGQRLLKHAEVKARIDQARARRAKRMEIRADRVLEELALIAFADIGDVIKVNADGDIQVLPLDTVKPEARRAIGELSQKVTESRVLTEQVFDPKTGDMVKAPREVEKVQLSIKHHSKTAALRMLMDHLGMDAPKNVKIDTQEGLQAMLGGLGKLMSPAAFKEMLQAIEKQRSGGGAT
jgi:phage terminase small subunit